MSLIKTHRSKDIKRSTLVIAKEILDIVKKGYGIKLGNVYGKIKQKNSINQKNFIIALNFLYILGKIEYNKEYDEIKRAK